MKNSWSFLLMPLLDGIVLGSIVGGLMLYIAVQHNPQGEFYDLDRQSLVLGNAVSLFLSWLVPVTLVIFVVELLTRLFWRWLKRS